MTRGWTLVELLTVIAVVTFLLGMGVGGYLMLQRHSGIDTDVTTIHSMASTARTLAAAKGKFAWLVCDAEKSTVRLVSLMPAGALHFEELDEQGRYPGGGRPSAAFGTVVVPGRVGNGCLFEAPESYVRCGGMARFPLTEGFRIEMWIFPKENREQTIVSREHQLTFNLDERGSPWAVLQIGENEGSKEIVLENEQFWVQSESWSYIELSYDRFAFILKVNGVVVASEKCTLPVAESNSPLLLGKSEEGFSGIIDEFVLQVIDEVSKHTLSENVLLSNSQTFEFRPPFSGELSAPGGKQPREIELKDSDGTTLATINLERETK